MLYIPQCVKAAVLSNAITTKLRVPALACPHDSSGESSPPGLPSPEQALEPFTVMLSIMLMGNVLRFSNVLLVRWNRESPLATSVLPFGAEADRENDNSKSPKAPTWSFIGGLPPLGESNPGPAGCLSKRPGNTWAKGNG